MNQHVMPLGDSGEWRPVVGYEGLYEVSDQGRVRSVDRKPARGSRRGRLLRLTAAGYGYLSVSLHRNGRQQTATVHSLVADAFLGPRPDGMTVCHGPAGKLDNTPANLSYGTHAKNMGEDRRRDGTANTGVRNGQAKLDDEIVRECRVRAADGESLSALAREFGVTRAAMTKAVKGITWRHAA